MPRTLPEPEIGPLVPNKFPNPQPETGGSRDWTSPGAFPGPAREGSIIVTGNGIVQVWRDHQIALPSELEVTKSMLPCYVIHELERRVHQRRDRERRQIGMREQGACSGFSGITAL
jgi:hypothetical protein